jgi:hypothetical protein
MTGPSSDPPKYPGSVLAAAIVWIAIGTATVFNAAWMIVVVFGWFPGSEAATSQSLLFTVVATGAFQAVVGGVFLYEGIETCRGALPSIVGIAIGSLLLSLILLGSIFFRPGLTRVHAAVAVLVAVALFVAAILALRGASPYERWWKARHRPTRP